MTGAQAGTSLDPSAADDAERKQRRKIQNRLNQRARRNRINNDGTSAKKQNPTFGVKLWRLDEFDLQTSSGSSKDKEELSVSKYGETPVEQDHRLFLTNMYKGTLSTADVELYSQQFNIHGQIASSSSSASPLSDHLLHLINYNVFRGLFYNKVTLSRFADHLVVGPDRTEKLDIMTGLKRDAICDASAPDIPPHLRPTPLQSSKVHGIWIDLIPFPRMRDNLIMHQEHFNHRLLVSDLMGNLLEEIMITKYGEGTGPKGRRRLLSRGRVGDIASDRSGMIIWGEPHRMESWEVTQGFLERWGWAVEGCHELMSATNRWRALRREVPLLFETQGTRRVESL